MEKVTRIEEASMLHKIDTVIVGGGQAGLAISYYLTREGREPRNGLMVESLETRSAPALAAILGEIVR
jgi:cation diffusion facilitator CzcD-associated flavoprotein CzcO